MADQALFIQGPGNGTVVYDADLMRLLISVLFAPGVVGGSGAVTPRAAGINRSVDVADVVAVVVGTDTMQGSYLVRLDGRNQEIAPAPGSGVRHDLVCVRVLDATAGGPAGLHKPDIVVQPGVASATPEDPELPKSSEALARVVMPAGAVNVGGGVGQGFIELLARSATLNPALGIDTAALTGAALAAALIPDLSAGKITSGTLHASRIPDLAAGKITSGTLHADRIPDLAAGKITSGVLPIARGGTGAASAAEAIGTLGAYGKANAPAGHRIVQGAAFPSSPAPANDDIHIVV